MGNPQRGASNKQTVEAIVNKDPPKEKMGVHKFI